MNARVSLRARGRVQGVFYRASTQEQASVRGLTGYVRNESDGSVSAVVEGPREAIESLIRWCEKGPTAARVNRLELEWSEPTGEFTYFEVRV